MEKFYTVNNYLNGDPAFFYCFDGQSDVVSNEIKKGNIWERDLHDKLKELIKDDFIVIEAGTHIGTHTVLLSKLAKKVIGFEPFPATYELMKKNIELNKLDNVTLHNKALSNESKSLRVEYHNPIERNIGGWGIKFSEDKSDQKDSAKFIDVDVITIDSLQLDRLDFIKLDVEQEELNVILGGMETIKKFKPIIILEDWFDYPTIDLQKTAGKFKVLIDAGYKIIQPKHGDPDFLFVPKTSPFGWLKKFRG